MGGMPSLSLSERTKAVLLGVLGVIAVVFWGYLLTASPKSDPFTPPPGVLSSNVATATGPRVTSIGSAARVGHLVANEVLPVAPDALLELAALPMLSFGRPNDLSTAAAAAKVLLRALRSRE